MAIAWWFIQLLINYTQNRKPTIWFFYISNLFKKNLENSFTFDELGFFDKWVFLLFYNKTGFEALSTRFKKVNEFIFKRFVYYDIYKLFLQPYKNGLKKRHFDLDLKTLSRDFDLLVNVTVNEKNAMYKIILKTHSHMVRYLYYYVTFYRFYAPIYFYLSSSLGDDFKTFDWKPENNYYFLHLMYSSLFETEADVVTIDVNKINDFYFYQDHVYSYVYTPFVHVIKSNPLQKKYYDRLEKIKNAYQTLYKPVFFYQLFTKDWQNFSINKFNPSSYLTVNETWKSKLQKLLFIRFSESSVTKHISLKDVKKYTIYYIRKNKIFNKGRYSRNRQLYRTGVYWCLWLNIMIVYALYFYFYRFTFNFGYMWWILGFFGFSFIFGRALQHNLYNPTTLYFEFLKTTTWFSFLLKNLLDMFDSVWKKFYKAFTIWLHANVYSFKDMNNEIWWRLFRSINWFSLNFGPRHHRRFAYIWQSFGRKDTSFLRYKSIIHWFKQLWIMLTTY